MNKLEGYKTFISLAIVLAGFLGIADLFAEGDIEVLVNSLLQIVGIVGAGYGRYKAKKVLS